MAPASHPRTDRIHTAFPTIWRFPRKVRRVFDAFDANGNGRLDAGEFWAALSELGFPPEEPV